MMNLQHHTLETLKARLDGMEEGEILIVPLENEKEEDHAVRTRKRLNSYGERAAALMQ